MKEEFLNRLILRCRLFLPSYPSSPFVPLPIFSLSLLHLSLLSRFLSFPSHALSKRREERVDRTEERVDRTEEREEKWGI